MSTYELIVEFTKYTVPSVFVFGAVYYFTNRWYEIKSQQIKFNASLEVKDNGVADNVNARTFFPLQIDAVQRLVLFLERIAPNNMVMRVLNPGLPAKVFQQKLLDAIRSEFEHNLAQQVYITSETWEVVMQSKEEVIKIINMSATKLNDKSLAGDLAQNIFEITAQLKKQPTELAIEMLKKELRKQL